MSELATPSRRATLRQDSLVALAVALLLVVGSDVALSDDLWVEAPDLVGPLLPGPSELVFLLAATLPLAFRRIAPLTVFATCVGAALAVQAVGRPTPLPLGVLVALYTVAVMRRPLVSGGAAAAYLALLVAGAVAGLAPLSDDLAYSYVVSVVAAVSLGYGVALSRARASLAEQQTVELAREQEVRTRTAVEQEQARIAREMHDIVAHDVSVIVAQAAATRRVLSQEPEEAARSLSSIEAVGRDALDGLRRLVSPLRTESAATDRSPQPDLDRLPWLLAQVRRAGLPVDLVIHGRPSPLSAAVELNAYRIVQEALTNSLKHAAGGARATVTLEYADDALSVEVHDETVDDALAAVPAQRVRWKPTAAQERDHGRSSTETSAIGFGMISMRQRATMLGGDFSAGPDNGGGFRVAARLPVDGVTR